MLAPHLSALVLAVSGRPRFTLRRRHFSLVICLALTAAASPSPAASGTWSSTAASGSWQTTTNWLSGIVPGATSGTTNTDTATFNSTSSTTLISPDSNRNLQNIIFDTSAAEYTVGLSIGNALLLTSGGEIQIASTFSGVGVSEGVGAPLKLEGSYTFADNTTINGDLLNFGGAITSGAAGAQTLTVAGGGNTTLNGVIGGGTGTIALTKNGAGILTLAGNNTFTGGVTINSGSVFVSSSGALNSAAPNAVVFGAGSFPELDLGVSVTVSGLVSTNPSAVPFVRGEGTSTTTLTVNTSVTNNFAGRLFDDASPLALVKGGVGTLILSDNNNFSGGVTINAGTLQLNAPAALFGPTLNVVTFGAGSTGTLDLNGFGATIGGLNTNSLVGTPVVTNSSSAPRTLEVQVVSGNSTYAGVLQDGPASGSLLLLKTGSGTLTLSGANTFTAPVNINGGTLAISGGSLAADVHNQATFNYLGGTFAGRLFNSGAVNFFSDFTAGNGMENDSNLSIGTAVSITLNGAGLDNEGTLSMAGVALNLSTTGANVNRGNINLSTVLSLAGGAAPTNSGSIALNGGVVTDASGTLTNTFGGAVSGVGTIQCGLANSGGVVSVGGGTLNITQPFTNSGIVQLTAFTANLGGGAINNTGAIQGFGNVGNAITNTGTIEPIGGTLFLSGTLLNPSGGLIRVGAGNKLLVVHGLLASAGIVNLTGGTFDNNGQPLNNLGQISGFGVFASGGTGLDNNGSITFSGGLTTVNGPVKNENGKTIVVAYNPAIFTGLVTNNGGGTFNIIGTAAVFAGGSSGSFSGTFTNNASSAFSVGGSGVLEVDGAPTLGAASSMAVGGTSTLRFKPTTGAATVGAGVTATVASGATLELAGSVSSLSAGANRVNITNSSSSPGILVSGTNQRVGNIEGAGTTQVNAGSDLTANHIVQSALVIGGTAASFGSVTIAASDANGNPLDVAQGGPLDAALGGSADFVVALRLSAEGFRGDPIPAGPFVGCALVGGNPQVLSTGSGQAVPEPSTLLLAFPVLCGLGVVLNSRRIRRRWIISCYVAGCALAARDTALAVNGTWTDATSGGLWSTTTNWSGGIVANGTDGIADFSTLNITADDAVHLDSARTIFHLLFGDTTPSNNWILDNNGNAANVLTLGGSPPVITVNNGTATISAALAGTQGLAEVGPGTLLLSGNNTFTGLVTINNSGTLKLGNAGALGATSNSVLVDLGTTLDLGGQAIGANALRFVAVGSQNLSALLINSSAGAASFAGTVGEDVPYSVGGTGDITLTGSVQGAFGLTKTGGNRLTLAGNTDNGGLGVAVSSGSVVLGKASSHSPDVHAVGSGLTINGGTVFLGGSGGDQINDGSSVTVNGGTFDFSGQSETFDALVGSGGTIINSQLFAPSTMTIGAAGGSGTFSGVIQNTGGAFTGLMAVTKIGAGTETLTGANTFTDPLNINGGTLALGGGSLAANVIDSANFTYNAGAFNGRLVVNGGTLTINVPFTAANGMENDGGLALSSAQPITLAGVGLDNEGTLTMAGETLILSTSGSAANVNRGTFNLSPTVPFNLNGATLTNGGTLNLNGGLLGGPGTLVNGAGGVVTGTGTISAGFSNTSGTLALSGGTTNITQAFTNSGLIQLTAFNSNLTGGAIANGSGGTIQGLGLVSNSIANNGTIEALGGTLSLNGALTNPAGGLIRVSFGDKVLAGAGLAANVGIINLNGGVFDNGAHALNNTGQISGWGILATGGTGLDNNGNITFSGGLMIVNGDVTNESGRTITVAYNPAIFTGNVIDNAGGTFHTTNTTITFAGGFTNNGKSNFSATGDGAVEITDAPTLNDNSTMSVTGPNTLRFNVLSGAATIGTGVTATVSSGATLELAGTVSALASGAHRVNIMNNSTATGLLVSGANQVVGGIDGSGTTQVNAGSDLTANHIVQSALVIGGTSGSPAFVTIAASDAAGNPVGQETADGAGLGGGGLSSSGLGSAPSSFSDLPPPSAEGFSGDPIPAGLPASVGPPSGNPSVVPEPSTLLLAILAVLGAVGTQILRHHFRCQTA